MDGLFRTIVMSFGEMEFLDLRYANATGDVVYPRYNNSNPDQNGTAIRELEIEIYFGRMIFIAFAFLFVIVVMNLLNAIAIQDIKVRVTSHPKTKVKFLLLEHYLLKKELTTFWLFSFFFPKNIAFL